LRRERERTRAAKTEALFREVNERIAKSSQRFEADEGDFVCECADTSCVHRITTPMDDYEDVREDGARFIVAPGHEDERIERVVRKRRDYQVVEKLGAIGALARRLNPRATEA
jgi:hypothetical protein